MINRGILLKSAREVLGPTIIVGTATGTAQLLLVIGISIVATEMGDRWASIDFVRKIIQAILGTELPGGFTPATFGAIVWVHPIMLMLVFSHALVTGSRLPAGETDRGTIDMLATLPVSRWSLQISDSLVCGLGGAIVLTGLFAGNRIGMSLVDAALQFPPGAIAATLVNFYVLYLAAAGMVRLFAAISESRGRAIGWSLGLLILSMLISFLAQFWSVAKAVSFLSVLEYYQPLQIAAGGVWPVRDILCLGIFAIVSWTAAGVVFRRRDVHVI